MVANDQFGIQGINGTYIKSHNLINLAATNLIEEKVGDDNTGNIGKIEMNLHGMGISHKMKINIEALNISENATATLDISAAKFSQTATTTLDLNAAIINMN
jgi:hypothetical protein